MLQATVLLLFALVALSTPFIGHAQYAPQNGTFDPQGANATCASIASLSDEDLGPCAFVVRNLSQEYYTDVNQLRRHVLGSIGLTALSFAPPECAKALVLVFCLGQMYRKCDTASVNGTNVTLARPICRRLCERMRDTCWVPVAVNPSAPASPEVFLDCDHPYYALWDINSQNPVPWPNRTEVPVRVPFPDGDEFSAPLECYDPGENFSFPLPIQTVCPEPFVLDPDEGRCSLGCPLPLVSDAEYLGLTITMDVLAWIGFALTGFLVLTYLLDAERRRFPAILPAYFIGCINASCFAFCLGSMIGHERVWCKDDARPWDFGGPACTVQGIIWVYSTMAGVFWWFALAINMVLGIVSEWTREFARRFHYVYHVAWFLPLITLLVALSGRALGYGGDVWCSVHLGPSKVTYYLDPVAGGTAADIATDQYLWNLLLLVVPILAIVFVGVAMVSAALVYIAFDRKRYGWAVVFEQRRVWLFLAFYVYLYVFVFAFEISLIAQKDRQFEEYRKFFACTFAEYIFKETGLPLPYDCKLDRVVSYPLWYIVVFNLSAQGIFVFLIFGTTRNTFRFWWRLFRCRANASSSRSVSGNSAATKKEPSRSSTMVDSIDTDEVAQSSSSYSEEEETPEDTTPPATTTTATTTEPPTEAEPSERQ